MDLPIDPTELKVILDHLQDHTDHPVVNHIYHKLSVCVPLIEQGLPYKKILREQYNIVA